MTLDGLSRVLEKNDDIVYMYQKDDEEGNKLSESQVDSIARLHPP